MPTPAESAQALPLPSPVAVFPLTGVLLLPGMVLPLHIFEPRYRAMVADARAGNGHIAMVQPFVPRQDNRPPPDAPPENPALYPVACLGRLAHCVEAPDGRFVIALEGRTRLRIASELPLKDGYRRVVPDYTPFAQDPEGLDDAYDGAGLQAALARLQREGKMVDLPEDLRAVQPAMLLNGLCMSLPFDPAEKQALLEAADLPAREALLVELLSMGLRMPDNPEDQRPPPAN